MQYTQAQMNRRQAVGCRSSIADTIHASALSPVSCGPNGRNPGVAPAHTCYGRLYMHMSSADLPMFGTCVLISLSAGRSAIINWIVVRHGYRNWCKQQLRHYTVPINSTSSPNILVLPVDHPRPSIMSYVASNIYIRLILLQSSMHT